MKIFVIEVDENCREAIVRILIEAGFDVQFPDVPFF